MGNMAGMARAADGAVAKAAQRTVQAAEAVTRAEMLAEVAAARAEAARARAREAALAELVARAERARLVVAREAAARAEVARVAEARLSGRDAGPATGARGRVVRVWDPVVRLFHWGLVGAFLANAFVTEAGKTTHVWLGYGVAALVALRVVWGFVGSRHARFADFVPTPALVRGQIAEMRRWVRRPHAGHSPLGALMIYNILLTMAGLVATGYALTTVTFFGVPWVADLHETLVTWAEISALLHVVAVVVESRRLGVNLPKSMVTGTKRLP
ncbi:MAG: hypothetical protein RL216_2186 [Pseudomonadota bacterium]|jgi:cytochrome b